MEDFKVYLHYAMARDHYTPEPFQLVKADVLQGARKRWQRRKKTIMGFRGSTKTYTDVRRYIEWRWLRVPATQVIVQSSTDRLGGAITSSIMETLKHDPLFAHLKPKATSSTMAFSLMGYLPEKGEGLTAAGINTAMTGTRAHLYIFDDPEPDNNPEAMYERILAAFQEAELILHPVDHLWPSGEVPIPEQTQIVCVGQPHWTGTAYIPRPPDPSTGDVVSHPMSDSLFLKIPALRKVPVGTPGSINDHPEPWHDATHNGGEYAEVSMMPCRFPTKELIRKRNLRIIDPARWRLQMECDTNPLEGVGSVIKVTRLPVVHIDPWTLSRRVLIVDPADSEDGCEWGVAAGGLLESRIHILDIMGFRSTVWDEGDDMPGEEAWKTIFEYADQIGIQTIYLEKNHANAARACKRVLRKMDVQCSVLEYAATQNKLTRIVRSLDAPLNVGMVSFEPHVLQDPVNFRQMSELRHTRLPKPNDRLDALAGLVTVFIDVPNVVSVRKNANMIHRPTGDMRPPSFRSLPQKAPFHSLRKRA